MSNKIIFLADFYYPEFVGGAELNDYSLISRLVNERKETIWSLKCSNVDMEFIKNHSGNRFIISNFITLSEDVKDYMISNCNYIIYEHDHKYLKKRNPIFYKNFIAPKSELANYEFYKNAKSIVCLTKLAYEVLKKNTGLDNVSRIGSSVWLESDLNYIDEIRSNEKKDCYAIMDSDNLIKKREDCINYCKKNNLNFELIKDSNHRNFLKKLNQFKGLVFMTGHLETCCRIVVEAKMLGLDVITQKKLIGAASEKSFELNGKELVQEIRKVSSNSVNLFYGEEK